MTAWKKSLNALSPLVSEDARVPLSPSQIGLELQGGSQDLRKSRLLLLPCFQPFIASSSLTFRPVPSCSRRGQVWFAAVSFQLPLESWPLALGPCAAWTQRGPTLCPQVLETQSQSCSFSNSHCAHNLTHSACVISRKSANKLQDKYSYYSYFNMKKNVGR